MIIWEDTRQKLAKNAHIREQLEALGHTVIRNKLPVGDYCNMDNMRAVIDTKFGLQEVASNLTGDHERFRRECELSKELGIKLIILVQEPNITNLPNVCSWYNIRKRTSPKAVNGKTLYKIMLTMSQKYDIEWAFTTKQNCGERIIELLSK